MFVHKGKKFDLALKKGPQLKILDTVSPYIDLLSNK